MSAPIANSQPVKRVVVSLKRLEWTLIEQGLSHLAHDSRTKYIKLLQLANDFLSPDRTDRASFLYWNEFTKPEARARLVEHLKSRYAAKDIPTKLVILIKCLEKVPRFPAPELLQWRALLDAERLLADQLPEEARDVADWTKLSVVAHNLTQMASNRNVRLIATLYLQGLVLRPDEIVQTKYRGERSDQQNYLDLETGRWTINAAATKTFEREFVIPKPLCDQLKKLVNPKSEYLLSRINGQQYKDWSSFNKTWKEHVGEDAYEFRRSFVTWFNNRPDQTVQSLRSLAYILGHSLKTNQVHYTLKIDRSLPLEFSPAMLETKVTTEQKP